MVAATRHRSAHLETVIEFEGVEPDAPVGSAPRELDRHLPGVRRVVGLTASALAAVLVALVGTGIATGSAPSGGPQGVATSPAVVSACRPVGVPEPGGGEELSRCSPPVPTSPSAEVAMRDARDAAVARARVWRQAHDPATAYRWRSEVGIQRMGSP